MSDTAAHLSTIGEKSLEYLDQRATESFKRQLDLEESIWRSLPFFAAALIAASAMLAHAAASLPPLGLQVKAVLGYAFLVASGLAFLGSFVWLGAIPLPREFEYPARDAEVASYAAEIAAFHSQAGLAGEALDTAALRDLRIYMTKIFGEAAQSHFTNNQARLSARSQAVLFLLIGFGLAFACDATTLIPKILSQASQPGVRHVDAAGQNPAATARGDVQQREFRSPNPTAGADCEGRCMDYKNQRSASHAAQVDGGPAQGSARSKPSSESHADHGSSDSTSEANGHQNRVGSGSRDASSAAASAGQKVAHPTHISVVWDRNDRQQNASTSSKARVDSTDASCASASHEGE